MRSERRLAGASITIRRAAPVSSAVLAALQLMAFSLPAQADPFAEPRERMVEEAIVGQGVENPRVIEAMGSTPRHEFVSRQLRSQAYFDMSLPIGDAQTISAPYIVAYMTEMLDPQPTDRVLEIGTGSGYQAAVLSPLVHEVYTIEIVESLGRRAERTLQRLRYDNVHVMVGDGYLGWPEHAPFDKIIVTCSPEQVPQPLVDQLREGGLMVIPVGERYQQTLYLMRKTNGRLEAEALRPTLFVPMTGAAEERRVVQPDPARPMLVNGGFEEPDESGQFPLGWYYHRQMEREQSDEAPEGEHFVTFRNGDPGRPAHLLQGFPVDGRLVGQLRLSALVKHHETRPGATRSEFAGAVVTFYDQQRRELGAWWIGPLLGSRGWHRQEIAMPVPVQAREAILRLGLFGAVGEVSFDDIRLTSQPRGARP